MVSQAIINVAVRFTSGWETVVGRKSFIGFALIDFGNILRRWLRIQWIAGGGGGIPSGLDGPADVPQYIRKRKGFGATADRGRGCGGTLLVEDLATTGARRSISAMRPQAGAKVDHCFVVFYRISR
ncbi:MAG: hypothetical protein M5U07_10070 [Xanthobacteraceae bacterium]|nr:hypothetical protein [Xanthobacteraceae bacterium]